MISLPHWGRDVPVEIIPQTQGGDLFWATFIGCTPVQNELMTEMEKRLQNEENDVDRKGLELDREPENMKTPGKRWIRAQFFGLVSPFTMFSNCEFDV
jgi:hypothetical protein